MSGNSDRTFVAMDFGRLSTNLVIGQSRNIDGIVHLSAISATAYQIDFLHATLRFQGSPSELSARVRARLEAGLSATPQAALRDVMCEAQRENIERTMQALCKLAGVTLPKTLARQHFGSERGKAWKPSGHCRIRPR